MTVSREEFYRALERFATREDLERFVTKEDLLRFPTKEDLARELQRFVTKEDLRKELERYPTKEDLRNELERYATKDDLLTWARDLIQEFAALLDQRLERHTTEIKVLLEDQERHVRAFMEGVATAAEQRALERRTTRLERRVSVLEGRLGIRPPEEA